MKKSAILGAVLALGVAGSASAHVVGPVFVGGSEGTVVYPEGDRGNVLGGGAVTVVGRGESARYLHAPDGPRQEPRWATVVANGEDTVIRYRDAGR